MRQMLRGYVELAAGLAEAAGKRVVSTTVELLERAGVDMEEAERAVTTQLPPAVQKLETLAQEVVTAGRGGLDLAVGLARAEAEKAVERVGKLGDQVVKVGVVLAYLEGKLRGLEDGGDGAAEQAGQAGHRRRESAGSTSGAGTEAGTGKSGRAEALFAADWQPEAEREAEPALEWETLAGAAGWYTPEEPVTEAAPPRKTAVKRPTTKKTAAKKTTAAKGTTAKTAAAKKTAVKKTTAAKSTAKKAATAKKATGAKQAGPAKKAGTAKKAAPKKAAPKASAGESDV
ncbi:hypothetical protein [Kitasatospora kifunensis]|uniref:Outer membrane biosynthesis protein TonB n=1 Tax=Kitasatospora kifunensis TaxID=58351 RepID=A0A7W7R657_KITKI|nr:hypothetical protein [Kitasatospora kifunensis]MBB4926076.1 outer membrane biosynthesis protein TonB [Kitasatospora kifunensis]